MKRFVDPMTLPARFTCSHCGQFKLVRERREVHGREYCTECLPYVDNAKRLSYHAGHNVEIVNMQAGDASRVYCNTCGYPVLELKYLT